MMSSLVEGPLFVDLSAALASTRRPLTARLRHFDASRQRTARHPNVAIRWWSPKSPTSLSLARRSPVLTFSIPPDDRGIREVDQYRVIQYPAHSRGREAPTVRDAIL